MITLRQRAAVPLYIGEEVTKDKLCIKHQKKYEITVHKRAAYCHVIFLWVSKYAYVTDTVHSTKYMHACLVLACWTHLL